MASASAAAWAWSLEQAVTLTGECRHPDPLHGGLWRRLSPMAADRVFCSAERAHEGEAVGDADLGEANRFQPGSRSRDGWHRRRREIAAAMMLGNVEGMLLLLGASPNETASSASWNATRWRSTVLYTATVRFRAHDKCAGCARAISPRFAISSLPMGIRGGIFCAADCIREDQLGPFPGAVPPIGILTAGGKLCF